MALTILSLPQPPSWQGVCTHISFDKPLRYSVGQTYRRAGLDKELADGRPVVHGVEGGNLIDAHRGHLEQARDLVHDGDAGEAVLALAEIEERHDGGLLVLWRVALEDFGDDGLILLAKFERDGGVVVGRVAMLETGISMDLFP
jgi:hypothetical protein